MDTLQSNIEKIIRKPIKVHLSVSKEQLKLSYEFEQQHRKSFTKTFINSQRMDFLMNILKI